MPPISKARCGVVTAARPSWLDRLRLRPTKPRGFYLRQAGLIAAALAIAVPTLFYVFAHDGSLVWLFLVDVLVLAACGRMAMGVLQVLGAFVGSAEGILVILAAGAMLVVIPAVAPVCLVWALVQAGRAVPEPA